MPLDYHAIAHALREDGDAVVDVDGVSPEGGYLVPFGHAWRIPRHQALIPELQAYVSDHAVALSLPRINLMAYVDGEDFVIGTGAVYHTRRAACHAARTFGAGEILPVVVDYESHNDNRS